MAKHVFFFLLHYYTIHTEIVQNTTSQIELLLKRIFTQNMENNFYKFNLCSFFYSIQYTNVYSLNLPYQSRSIAGTCSGCVV